MIIKHIRITNYNRLIDRFLTAQVKKSSDVKKTSMGKIFAVVEILNPWHPNAQIGQTIINTLTRSYYKSSNSNELINFEIALKETNKALARIAQNGETDWIGKLNAILVVIRNNKLHLAYTGKVKAYLIREEKILPIIGQNMTYPQEYPLKTFTNIISGMLQTDDKVILSSPLLMDYLTPQKLKEIIGNKPLSETIMDIVQIVKSNKVTHLGSIFIELSEKGETSPKYPEAIYLDQQKFDLVWLKIKKIINKLKTNFETLGKHTERISISAKQYYQTKILPKTKEVLQKTKTISRDKIHQIQNKRGPIFKTTTEKIPANKSYNLSKKMPQLLVPEKEHSNFEPNVHHYHTKSTKIKNSLTKFVNYLKLLTRKFKVWLSTLLLPKNRSKLYIGIAVLLVIILVGNIGYLRSLNQKKEQTINYEQELSELANKKDDAKLASLANQNKKALDLLEEVRNSLTPLLENEAITQKAKDLLSQVQVEVDKISKTTRLQNPVQIANFDAINTFYIIDQNIYIINPNNNQIYRFPVQKNQTPSEITKLPVSSGLFKTAAVMGESFYIYTQQKNVFEYRKEDLSKIDLDEGSWSNATAIAAYLTNLYFLDGEQGQIYKYIPQADTYSAPNEYIDTDKIDIKNSIDFAIDGTIYVLRNDGAIVKITLGKLQDFEIKGIPEPNSSITKSKQIYTNEDINSLYVLDDNRILELNKSGEFIAQYAFPAEFTNIKHFSINEKSKELLILNDNTIYKFGL